MKCKHESRTFISYLEVRGYPEKLFICEDCGCTISDFVSNEDRYNFVKSSGYKPSIVIGLTANCLDEVAALI